MECMLDLFLDQAGWVPALATALHFALRQVMLLLCSITSTSLHMVCKLNDGGVTLQ